MEELRARAESLGAGGPLFSILLPIYQTPERWLRRCIESVLAQVYPNWQLCIVDDASPDMRAMEVVEEYARGDERIEFMRRDVNGHISERSEEHTSELQSLMRISYAVFCLKKKRSEDY